MPHQIKELFASLQEQLSSSLAAGRAVLPHPVAKGEAAESNWLNMLQTHLPHRYQADKAFVVDANGECSDQIDVVIYDRQYTPMLYNRDGQRFVPAESVYAVFEVKQNLSRAHIAYAGEKAASVRRLQRTSAKIPYAAGQYQPRPLFQIIAGILAYESEWNPAFGEPFMTVIQERPPLERLDLGCAVASGTFDVQYQEDGSLEVQLSSGETTLILFFLRLLERLQSLGTVSAIDYAVYSKALTT